MNAFTRAVLLSFLCVLFETLNNLNPRNVILFVKAEIINTYAGNGRLYDYDVAYDGENKNALSTPLNGTKGIAFDSSDNLYIADSGNKRVRKVSNFK